MYRLHVKWVPYAGMCAPRIHVSIPSHIDATYPPSSTSVFTAPSESPCHHHLSHSCAIFSPLCVPCHCPGWPVRYELRRTPPFYRPCAWGCPTQPRPDIFSSTAHRQICETVHAHGHVDVCAVGPRRTVDLYLPLRVGWLSSGHNRHRTEPSSR